MSLPCSTDLNTYSTPWHCQSVAFHFNSRKGQKDSFLSLLKWNGDGSLSASLTWGIVVHLKMSNLDQMSNCQRDQWIGTAKIWVNRKGERNPTYIAVKKQVKHIYHLFASLFLCLYNQNEWKLSISGNLKTLICCIVANTHWPQTHMSFKYWPNQFPADWDLVLLLLWAGVSPPIQQGWLWYPCQWFNEKCR